MTKGVIQAETSLLQYAESYFFVEEDDEQSLASALPHALTLAEVGRRSGSREVRLAADMLHTAVDSLATRLDRVYLGTGAATQQVLTAHAADHGVRPRA